MQVVADLHLHSRFSRAVSSSMTVPVIHEWAAKKGIGLVSTADWTHPLWSRELESSLEEAGEGLYRLKGKKDGPLFLLSTEISSIYSQGGKGRKIHTLVFAPNFAAVKKINKELASRGANLFSDGRPILGLTAKSVAQIALSADPRSLIIPAHAWTPHFSIFGSNSGFNSIEECYEEISPYIYAIETGLSSDPAMNWRISELTGRNIVSFSDAHSAPKLGREATVFELEELTFENVHKAIRGSSVFGSQLSASSQPVNQLTGRQKTGKQLAENRQQKTDNRVAYTIEFYPEEGKYHYTGHRNCKVVYSPNETRKLGTVCPICGRPLTVGVMSRVEELAHGNEIETQSEIDEFGVRWIKDKEGKRPKYVMLVPLAEILAEALEVGSGSQKVVTSYESIVTSLGSEFKILLSTPIEDIAKVSGQRVAEGVGKVRSGDISIAPGYDGVFGKVKIWPSSESSEDEKEIDQGSLF